MTAFWNPRQTVLPIWFLGSLLAGCGGGGSGDSAVGGDSGDTNGTIGVAWEAMTQPVAGYKVYYGTAPNIYVNLVDVGALAPSGGSVSYTIRGLTTGRRYYITVSAYDTFGNESGASSEVMDVAK